MKEDVQKSLGISIDVDVESGKIDSSKYEKLSQKVLESYPNVKKIAITLRESKVRIQTDGAFRIIF